MTYTFTDILWLFFLYSFAGWCIEVCYAAVCRKKFVNRGLVNSPLCPIYGFGSVLFCLFLPELTEKPFFLFLGGLLLGIIESLAKAYISTQLANSIVFAVLIIVLLVRPAGLLGKYVPEKV